MEMFTAIEGSKPKKGRYTFNIYQVFDGRLSYIGQSRIQYGMTKGPESEVMDRLAKEGYIDGAYT